MYQQHIQLNFHKISKNISEELKYMIRTLTIEVKQNQLIQHFMFKISIPYSQFSSKTSVCSVSGLDLKTLK